ncbi:MAG TPA: hypothetical protein VE934_14100, partial [Polaromonas sp.]|uniref:hypothetical protein n=1 Tax=Polaromonas sp. TaxID=1869339 RepID=UPI002D63929D
TVAHPHRVAAKGLRRVPHPAKEEESTICKGAEKSLWPVDREKPYQRWRPGAAEGRRRWAEELDVSAFSTLLISIALLRRDSLDLLSVLKPDVAALNSTPDNGKLPMGSSRDKLTSPIRGAHVALSRP